ncbi:(2Fe-2S)-binding protein [Photobacterium angustum]|uniref:class I ribonucleotide reductase maintenance protein YfaE n=1 Tax=Photobacterium angustum TaxID=661 RepID=UPI0005E169BC|nr:class I ribonucleotide reductase maintenance protein YfaE [Photobacterium angustum]KJG05626.1 (2Fe-2S)-binding protein [Photobacterium angustum]PSV91107.1 (2Fe-2S)-binding protein [Photobacterium angustum]
MSQLTIKVNGVEVHGNNHEPLLKQLEQAGVQPEYQCRNGMCGACRCKLKQGAVDQHDALAFIAQNEILTCRSIPKSDIEIEFSYQVTTKQETTKKVAQ